MSAWWSAANGVNKTLRRPGLNTRARRLSLIAGYRARYPRPREPEAELRVTSARPGKLVGMDCFYVGRLRETAGTVWQISAIDTYSGYGWADLVTAPNDGPGAEHTSRLAPGRRRTEGDGVAA